VAKRKRGRKNGESKSLVKDREQIKTVRPSKKKSRVVPTKGRVEQERREGKRKVKEKRGGQKKKDVREKEKASFAGAQWCEKAVQARTGNFLHGQASEGEKLAKKKEESAKRRR